MTASLLILYEGHGGLAQEGAGRLGTLAQRQGYRVRALSFDELAPTHLAREHRVLFILAPPLATGLFGAAGALWHQVVRHASFDFHQLHFSVLVLGPNYDVEPCFAGRDLERALRRQGARRIYPRLECSPDDEISLRVWLCGALAALSELRPGPRREKTSGETLPTRIPDPEGIPAVGCPLPPRLRGPDRLPPVPT